MKLNLISRKKEEKLRQVHRLIYVFVSLDFFGILWPHYDPLLAEAAEFDSQPDLVLKSVIVQKNML